MYKRDEDNVLFLFFYNMRLSIYLSFSYYNNYNARSNLIYGGGMSNIINCLIINYRVHERDSMYDTNLTGKYEKDIDNFKLVYLCSELKKISIFA